LGYLAHKKSVDWLNFFLLRCLNILGTSFEFNNPFNIPDNCPLIIVSNHQSTYDIPPIIWYFRKYHPKFISKSTLGSGIPSVSYNLRYGGSVLIDRGKPIIALKKIKDFGEQVQKNQWAAVIFPEGTRSNDGNPKKFFSKGLMTLFKQIPDATVVALCINNSWKLGKYRYFPIPAGVKVSLKVKAIFKLSDHQPEDLFHELEQLITSGIQRV
jgi:1-acyl-sn-glycerol-3-phosphate acyltransferase